MMKNNALPLIMSRIFNVPLMIHEPKLDVILMALRDRLGLDIQAAAAENAPDRYKLNAEAKREDAGKKNRPVAVAVIPVHDTLVHRHTIMQSYSGMTSYLFIRSAFRKAMASNDVAAVVLHIDSPGGEGHGVQELAREIYEARGRKPVYAAVDGDALSAGYYIASAADRIFLTESSNAGSIGVIGKHIDQSSYNEKQGFKVTTFYAGARKNDFSPHEPLTEDARKVGMEMITQLYDLFVRDVTRYRNLSEDYVRGTEAGIYWGQKAIDAGLADEIGTLDDTVQAALEASSKRGVKNITTTGVHPERKNDMEKLQSLGELVAAYPEFAAQLREEGRASVDINAAGADKVTAERERILGLAAIQFGEEAGKRFGDIVASGVAVDQYKAIAAVNPPVGAETPESKRMAELLAAINQTGKESPGAGADAAIASMAEGPEKWKAQFERDPQLREEFKQYEHYAAFMKGMAEGRIKILKREVQ
jgi:signal peptide peptidase SppA